MNRYVNKQLKKENKEVLKLKEDVYVSRNVQYYNYYPLGTILRDIYTNEEIVYLFKAPLLQMGGNHSLIYYV